MLMFFILIMRVPGGFFCIFITGACFGCSMSEFYQGWLCFIFIVMCTVEIETVLSCLRGLVLIMRRRAVEGVSLVFGVAA